MLENDQKLRPLPKFHKHPCGLCKANDLESETHSAFAVQYER
jgi:hypothetical protein